MRVCVVGSGAREHALCDVLGRSATSVVVTPGNPGIRQSTPTPPEAIEADLFVVGPEAPLVAGLADRLRARGRLVFGPGADGARLEGSKEWMKALLIDAGVPSARHAVFGPGDEDLAVAYLRDMPGLYVVKTDGLAGGKGVLVTESLADAADDVREKLAGRAFGDAGRRVVIEEGLTGPELSLLCVCDGERVVSLAPAQDYKRVGDGDQGPNTGGMGARSPVPGVDDRLVDQVVDSCVLPTLAALRARGIDYRGVLYAGLMLTPDGPKVLEFNVRFGDPEAQVVLPRFQGDLTALLAEAAAGWIRHEPAAPTGPAVTIVCASAGYPAGSSEGGAIGGLAAAAAVPGVSIYCGAVGVTAGGTLVTGSGRVLSVTGQGPDERSARDAAYSAVRKLSWPGMVFRSDIAVDSPGSVIER